MTKKEIFFIDYTLLRSKRKTLSITITREGAVIVRAPFFMLRSTIEAYLTEKAAWIERHQERNRHMLPRKTYTQSEKEVMRNLLKVYLQKRVHELWSHKHIPTYTSLKVTLSERRWGSCSQKNGLCFSYRLAEYIKEFPDFIDAIITHELAHIVHKNHQKPFWNLVYAWMPEYEVYMKSAK